MKVVLGGGANTVNLTSAAARFSGGARLTFEVLGGGADQLSVTRNGSAGTVLLSGGALLATELHGGPQNDVLALDLGGDSLEIDGGVVRFRADGGSGHDTLSLSADARAASAAPRFDVSATGGPGDDALSLAIDNGGLNDATAYAPAGLAFADGSLGFDTCNTSGNGRFRRRNCEDGNTTR